jgi:hypothetical protein
MRWGAHPRHGAEAASCTTLDADHTKRFDDERRMRNAIDRPPAGYTLQRFTIVTCGIP